MKLLVAALLLATALPFAAQAAPARPEADTARDAVRKPADMVSFAKIKTGSMVTDIIPGGGYFTRMFAEAVGPNGRVTAVIPPQAAARNAAEAKAVADLGNADSYGNVSVVASPAQLAPGSQDMIWTAQNYHDLHNALPPEGVVGFNKAVLAALKPGGVFVVVDHAAMAGSGFSATNTLHRIDPEALKAEVVSSGFVFDGESKAIANAADDHMKNVFDPAIRGKTDQFVYRFRKP